MSTPEELLGLPSYDPTTITSPRSLAELFEVHGHNYATIAALVVQVYEEVTPELFQRVDEQVQPLSLDVAQSIADILGLSAAEVQAAAFFVTALTGPDYRVARPPTLGDDFSAAPYRKVEGT